MKASRYSTFYGNHNGSSGVGRVKKYINQSVNLSEPLRDLAKNVFALMIGLEPLTVINHPGYAVTSSKRESDKPYDWLRASDGLILPGVPTPSQRSPKCRSPRGGAKNSWWQLTAVMQRQVISLMIGSEPLTVLYYPGVL